MFQNDKELMVALRAAINTSAMTDEFRLGATLTVILLPNATPETIVETYVTIGEVHIDDLLRRPTLYVAHVARALLRVRAALSPDTVRLAEAADAAFPAKEPHTG